MVGQEEEVRITLRMPARVRDQISEAAAENNRSMNAEIISRLEDSMKGPFSEPRASEIVETIREIVTRHMLADLIDPELAEQFEDYTLNFDGRREALEHILRTYFSEHPDD